MRPDPDDASGLVDRRTRVDRGSGGGGLFGVIWGVIDLQPGVAVLLPGHQNHPFESTKQASSRLQAYEKP